jgi:hypothetical protein
MSKYLLKLGAFTAALAVAVLCATPAQAAFKIRISDGINTVTAIDNVQNDSSNTLGSISYTDTTSFNGYSIVVTVGTSKPLAPNSSNLAFEDIAITATFSTPSSGNFSNKLTVDLTDTGFNLNSVNNTQLSATIGNNSSSSSISETFQAWVDPSNTEFGGIPNGGGGTTGTAQLTAGGGDPHNTSTVNWTGTDPFSMSTRTVLTFGVAGTASIDNNNRVVTPAPAGLLLLLSGSPMLGLGYWLRRRKTAAAA